MQSKLTEGNTPVILNYDRVLFVDVDDTLVTFEYKPEDISKCVLIGVGDFKKSALPLLTNIDKLRNARVRGHGVVVWSQGGYEWASEVVRALNLEAYVDLIVSKPNWIYDDLPVEAWMGPRFYTPAYPEEGKK